MKSPIKRDANSVATMPVGKIFTLVFLKRNSSVLLGLKTRGLGEGLWNGFGGKVEENETVANCARREVEEECGVIASDLKQIGVVRYDLDYDKSADVVHIFTCSKFDGFEKPSEEMNPIKWYKYTDIPFEQMWPDAPKWYPFMLKDKYFSARVIYTDKNTIKDSIIQEFGSLSNALKLAQ
ncbi:unnamed protein product [Tenebrio molitor]|jgi:8-oxo-dGTP pyrophosphatase MutT (NUDIX family)|nr:unnamed protein product [Tenebrio molitor]